MDEQIPRPRQTQFTRTARTQRILERLREGWAYDEVAREERLAERRVRQIVTQFLAERESGSDADHAQMQIDRLGRAMRVAGDALKKGDIRAISPFVRVIDRLDRYQTLVSKAAAGEKRTVDPASDKLVIDTLLARLKRQAREELRMEAEGEAPAGSPLEPPPEPHGDSAAVPPPVVAEAQAAPEGSPPSVPCAPLQNGCLNNFSPYVRP